VSVTVTPLPTISSVTASPTAVCSGAPSTLTITASEATEYSFDEGATWQTANTKSVSPTATTTYTVKVRNATGCVSSTNNQVSVTVNPLPTISSIAASPTAVCSGASSTLTITASGATEYSFDEGATWQSTNT
jgi:hypothetical protein